MFTDNLKRYMEAVRDQLSRASIYELLKPLFDRQSSNMLNTAGLVIHGSASALAKTGATDCYGIANGVVNKIAASTDMPALVGTVTNATFGVFCFFMDSAGVVTSAMGTGGATLGAMVFPQLPTKKALVGFLLINPTGTGDFIGGTTALDDGTVVPNTIYVNSVSGFDPYCVIG